MIHKGVVVGHESFTLHGLHNAGRNLSITFLPCTVSSQVFVVNAFQ